ncbi:MAG: T9SS type A sorting domain-containing protein, partial [Bacteroidia bacterium]
PVLVYDLRSAVLSTGFVIGSGTLVIQVPVSQFGICSADRLAAPAQSTNDDINLSMVISPNPVSLNSPVLQLKMNSPAEQQIEIRITDMLGREVLNQKVVITQGESVQQIQLPSGISAGVYTMSISGNGVNENHRFVME